MKIRSSSSPHFCHRRCRCESQSSHDRSFCRRRRSHRAPTLMRSAARSDTAAVPESTAHRRLGAIASHLASASSGSGTHGTVLAMASASAASTVATIVASVMDGGITHEPPPGHSSHPDHDASYSSRQIPLFQQGNEKLSKAQQTDIRIDDIVVHAIPRIHDHLPNLPSYPNRFARTKASLPRRNSGAMPPAFSPTAHLLRSPLTAISARETTPPNEHPSTGMPIVEDVQYSQLIKEGDVVLLDIVRRSGLGPGGAKSFIRAGPREQICWAPGEAVAAIVTCGGLCPGLNDVISELFNTLYYNYGVNRIHGIRSGFRGFWDPKFYPWLDLTPEGIRGIDALGGTVLGSSRGGFNLDAIMQACLNRGVNQLYIIGGDGTHRAADLIQHEARRRQIKLTVACVPKTIDNDIGVIDRSFGFNTAVSEARKAIQSALVEASCAPNGLGIVQLMGRHAGYIAAHATLASRQVDLTLIPEVPFPLEGPYGVLALTEQILQRQGYGVIVVAEGAGADLLPTIGVDESGNRKLPEIGKFLQSEIARHFKERKLDLTIKYHDPSYMIRSVPADASDSVYCMTLAHNAVHGAMCGFTGFTSGLVNNRTVLLPIPVITATSPSYLNPDGRTWERVLSLTHQPSRIWDEIAQEKKKQAQAVQVQQAH